MPDAYTYVSKPTSSVYSLINPQGKEQYDQSDVLYDSTTVFYDGVNENAYTTIAKPTGESVAATGLYYGFGAFTYSGGQILQSDYTNINKPTT